MHEARKGEDHENAHPHEKVKLENPGHVDDQGRRTAFRRFPCLVRRLETRAGLAWPSVMLTIWAMLLTPDQLCKRFNYPASLQTLLERLRDLAEQHIPRLHSMLLTGSITTGMLYWPGPKMTADPIYAQVLARMILDLPMLNYAFNGGWQEAANAFPDTLVPTSG